MLSGQVKPEDCPLEGKHLLCLRKHSETLIPRSMPRKLYVNIFEYACNHPKSPSIEARYRTIPAHMIPSLHNMAYRTSSLTPPSTYIFFTSFPPRNFPLHPLTFLYNHNIPSHTPYRTHTHTHTSLTHIATTGTMPAHTDNILSAPHSSRYGSMSIASMGSCTPGHSKPRDTRYGQHLEVAGQSGARSSSSRSGSSSRPPSTCGISHGAPNHLGADPGFRPCGAHLSKSHGGSSRGPGSHSSNASTGRGPASHQSGLHSHSHSHSHHHGLSTALVPSHAPPSSYRPSLLSPGSFAPSTASNHPSRFPFSKHPPTFYPLHSHSPSTVQPADALVHGPHGPGPRCPGAVSLAWKTGGLKPLPPVAMGEMRTVVEFVETKIRHITSEREF
jgi:hypothetical protein